MAKRGSFAELSEQLSQKGYEYQYKAGQRSYHERGMAFYRNAVGDEKMLRRVARGEKAKWLPRPEGAKSWLAKTAGTADTWVMLRRRKK